MVMIKIKPPKKKRTCRQRDRVCQGGFIYNNIGTRCILCGSVITLNAWRRAQGLPFKKNRKQ
jgi:hypothetical protein